MRKLTICLIALSLALVQSATPSAEPQSFSLESSTGLRLHNVIAEPAALEGKKGVKVTISPEAVKKLPGMSAEERAHFNQLAVIEGSAFGSGVIEAEIAGAPAPGAGEGARGFVGLAFRVQDDMRTYDAFYLRPTNGRAEDQERRNHVTQYISHPDWPWFRLRKETPSRYESYVDMLPNAWTKVRIDVRGDKARLFVNNAEQPTLIVNDVKSGATAKGAVALWIDSGTVAHFRALSIKPM